MTFAVLSATPGRKLATIVELDLDFCSLTYGVAPCTAVLGVSSVDRCYNTRKTCPVPANYSPAAKTYRFSDVTFKEIATPTSLGVCLPMVKSVNVAPTKINPGQNFGQRASVTVTMQDGAYTDFGVDKYVTQRSYTPMSQGTFWGKLLARNPFYIGRPLRVRVGFLGDGDEYVSANFETYEYIIDKIDGPYIDGVVTITAKDLLKLADDKTSQFPLLTNGTLSLDMGAGDASFTALPSGIGSTYAASGWVACEAEIMAFTRVGDVFSVTRAQFGSVAATHKINSKVQQCGVYTNQLVQDIFYDLLVNFAGVPSANIDKTAWDLEVATWMSDYRLSTVITKPTGVKQLLDELTEQGLVYVWWDERESTIPLKAIRPALFVDTVVLNDQANILNKTLAATQDVTQRLTAAVVYYQPRDYTNNLDKAFNYLYGEENVDTDAESDVEYGQTATKTIFSRWLTDSASAALLAQRIVERYRDSLITLKFQLDVKDAQLVWTGDDVSVTTRMLQGPDGASLATRMQILSVQPKGDRYEYTALASVFNGRFGFWTDDAAPDFSAATDLQKETLGFWCDDTGKMPDGSDGYQWI